MSEIHSEDTPLSPTSNDESCGGPEISDRTSDNGAGIEDTTLFPSSNDEFCGGPETSDKTPANSARIAVSPTIDDECCEGPQITDKIPANSADNMVACHMPASNALINPSTPNETQSGEGNPLITPKRPRGRPPKTPSTQIKITEERDLQASFTPTSRLRGKPQKSSLEEPAEEEVSPELHAGYKILQDIISRSTKFFLEAPAAWEKGLLNFYEVIENPIWLRDIEIMFNGKEYQNITEIVRDIRQLLLNTYRFFGPDNVNTKRALRLEGLLEKEIASLPEELRAKCTLEATHGSLKDDEEGIQEAQALGLNELDSSCLLRSVMGEKFRRAREQNRRLGEELEAEKEGLPKERLDWESNTLLCGKHKEHLRNMWELPGIGHFVALSLPELNIEKISMYELERMFLIPQTSTTLAKLMTTLLSTPLSRLKLHVKPAMPYKIWTAKLNLKVSGWYKLYTKAKNMSQTVFEKLGIEPIFWKILGPSNPLEDHEFHELTYYQRVVLVKSLCDYIFHNHKCINVLISEKTDEFGVRLGVDRKGAKLLYFPQFLNTDVRVYKQHLDPKSWEQKDEEHHNPSSLNQKKVPYKTRKRHRRHGAWQQGNIIKRKPTPHKTFKSIQTSTLKCIISKCKMNGYGDEQNDSKCHTDASEIKTDDMCNILDTKVNADSKGEESPDFKGFLKEKKPLYTAPWLDPDPKDWELVADSVEALRDLIKLYVDDDVPLNQRLVQNPRPSCEIKLVQHLEVILTDLKEIELTTILNMKKVRERLHTEWLEMQSQPDDYVHPDEAFWLNEKEPTDAQEPELAELQPQENAVHFSEEVLDNAEGRTLRHRREDLTPKDNLTKFHSTDESEESDYDESEDWEMPRKKRKKQPKTPRRLVPLSQKKDAPLGKALEADDDGIEILDEKPKNDPQTPAAFLKVRRKLVLESEAPSTEAARQTLLKPTITQAVQLAGNKRVSSMTLSKGTLTILQNTKTPSSLSRETKKDKSTTNEIVVISDDSDSEVELVDIVRSDTSTTSTPIRNLPSKESLTTPRRVTQVLVSTIPKTELTETTKTPQNSGLLVKTPKTPGNSSVAQSSPSGVQVFRPVSCHMLGSSRTPNSRQVIQQGSPRTPNSRQVIQQGRVFQMQSPRASSPGQITLQARTSKMQSPRASSPGQATLQARTSQMLSPRASSIGQVTLQARASQMQSPASSSGLMMMQGGRPSHVQSPRASSPGQVTLQSRTHQMQSSPTSRSGQVILQGRPSNMQSPRASSAGQMMLRGREYQVQSPRASSILQGRASQLLPTHVSSPGTLMQQQPTPRIPSSAIARNPNHTTQVSNFQSQRLQTPLSSNRNVPPVVPTTPTRPQTHSEMPRGGMLKIRSPMFLGIQSNVQSGTSRVSTAQLVSSPRVQRSSSQSRPPIITTVSTLVSISSQSYTSTAPLGATVSRQTLTTTVPSHSWSQPRARSHNPAVQASARQTTGSEVTGACLPTQWSQATLTNGRGPVMHHGHQVGTSVQPSASPARVQTTNILEELRRNSRNLSVYTVASTAASTTTRTTAANREETARVSQSANANTMASLVIIPGDGKTANQFALSFPNGSKVILTPEQVAQMRQANNGQLVTRFGF